MFFQQLWMSALAALLTILSTHVNAHMIMSSPQPYGKSTLNNSPLVADGSDFPCKQRTGVYDLEGASNVMAIGEPQTLSFIGSAVHGGGSCQVSLTTDLQPTKDSKWMVIKSIEGGCPSNVSGNLPADATGTGAAVFQYTIPDGITPGEYTIAWSWINKIGNREFYMNCGPATVTAAKRKRYAPAPKISKRQTSFPDMFVANLASINTCTTPETFDYNYPDPGSDVQSAGTGPYTQLSCAAANANAPAATPTASAAAGAASSGSGISSATTSVPAVVPTSLAGAGASSGNPGVFATGASSISAAAATTKSPSIATVSPLPATTGAASSSPAATSASSGSSGSGATSEVAGTPCTDEGAWLCSADGTSFQRCASGEWSASMAMATGMTCTPGLSDSIQMTPAKVKRRDNSRSRPMRRVFGRSTH